MLKAPTLKDPLRTDGRFAIVCSRYNSEYTEPMLEAARSVLEAAGASIVEVVRVPGAFEIPMAASALARRKRSPVRGIVCLGVLWQGETSHAEQIGSAVTRALMEISLATGIPCIHEVLTIQTKSRPNSAALTHGPTAASRPPTPLSRSWRPLPAFNRPVRDAKPVSLPPI